MKLFRILVLHGAPKDSHTATETYLVTDTAESVADWIEKTHHFGHWFTPEDGDEPSTRCVDCEGNPGYKDVTFKEYVMANCGDLKDEEGWEDAYYGVTKWGWEEVFGATPEDIATLIRLGIAKQP